MRNNHDLKFVKKISHFIFLFILIGCDSYFDIETEDIIVPVTSRRIKQKQKSLSQKIFHKALTSQDYYQGSVPKVNKGLVLDGPLDII